MIECIYGYEGEELPCILDPENYDCKTCAIVELTTVLQRLCDEGIKMYFVPLEEENLGKGSHRQRKAKKKQ